MSFMKNRTVLGIICIILSLLICFALVPMFNRSAAEKTQIVRVTRDIQTGDMITEGMIQTVDVGAYNLPNDVARTAETVLGKFAAADLVAGDYIMNSKLSDIPSAENEYLYNLDGSKQAISVTVRSLATGLSGKLMTGDIVSVIAPDYRKMGETVIPAELQYVKVIAVTASSGSDADPSTHNPDSDDRRELPATVTLLVRPEQAKVLAFLEADGKLHLALAYRGAKEVAALFIDAQDELIDMMDCPDGDGDEPEDGYDAEDLDEDREE
jgi:pilus assembly protein CpaB